MAAFLHAFLMIVLIIINVTTLGIASKDNIGGPTFSITELLTFKNLHFRYPSPQRISTPRTPYMSPTYLPPSPAHNSSPTYLPPSPAAATIPPVTECGCGCAYGCGAGGADPDIAVVKSKTFYKKCPNIGQRKDPHGICRDVQRR